MWEGFRGTIVVFVFVLLLLLIPFRRRKKKRRGFYLVTAQVEAVECQEKDTDDPQGRKMPQYRAVLELYGLDGQRRQHGKEGEETARIRTEWQAYPLQVGSQVRIWYNPKTGENFTWESEKWFFREIFIVLLAAAVAIWGFGPIFREISIKLEIPPEYHVTQSFFLLTLLFLLRAITRPQREKISFRKKLLTGEMQPVSAVFTGYRVSEDADGDRLQFAQYEYQEEEQGRMVKRRIECGGEAACLPGQETRLYRDVRTGWIMARPVGKGLSMWIGILFSILAFVFLAFILPVLAF